jgi:myo-inositol-1-phosphate synthase
MYPQLTGGAVKDMGKINVAIIGAGNCASSLVQGLYKYSEVEEDKSIPGLMHNVLGGYAIGDIEVVAAFDVDNEKVGKDLSDALVSKNNNAVQFHDVPKTGVTVSRGMTHDGIGEYLADVIEPAPGSTDDIVGILRERNVDVVINYLPVGSEQATKWYVEQVLAAECAFVNCIPVFVGGDKTGYWPKRFEDKGLPIVGDDIKSQVGATIVHRVLARLYEDRGVRLDRTYQLNFGGNTDFYNMLERKRLTSKKISKTQSVQSQLEKELPTDDVHIGPSDHVPWLSDRKWAYIRLEGTSWGDLPLNMELKLEVEDSPNSAGVAVDAIRSAKIALDKGHAGPVEGASAYFMKSPRKEMRDDDARRAVEEYAAGHIPAGTAKVATAAKKNGSKKQV